MVRTSVQKGFTLTELMITVAVLAIVVMMAVPGYSSLVAKRNIDTASNELISAFNFARSKALAMTATITICAKASSSDQCDTDRSFKDGWIIFADVDKDNRLDTNETLFTVHEGFEANIHLQDINSLGSAVGFTATGREGSVGVKTLAICDRSGRTARTRGVVLTVSGQSGASELKASEATDCLGS